MKFSASLIITTYVLLAGYGTQHAWAQAPSFPTPRSYTTIEPGHLPIILSAPHGGRDSIPGVDARLGNNVRMFKTQTDMRSGQLAQRLADALEKQLGKRPYVIIARFHRKYLDANRPQELAYESSNAKPVYDAYHRAIAEARDDVVDRWGQGILLDIHGQANNATAIYRGTQNGKTTTHLIGRFGRESLIGRTSLFGQLANQGLSVIPDVGVADREHSSYDGGYIVNTYGSRAGGTVDAIQLELGNDLRSSQNLSSTASKVATAITAFASDYLPKSPRDVGTKQDAGQP